MNRYERLTALLELLAERGRVEVDDIAEELQVSAATIRRDLDHLAEQQLLTRTRGGAVAHAVSYDLPLRYKTARHADAKLRIAAPRPRLVGGGGGRAERRHHRDRGGAGAGRPATPSWTGLTIVTNALNIANELTVRHADQDGRHRRRGPAAVLRADRAAGPADPRRADAGRDLPRRRPRGPQARRVGPQRGRGQHQPAAGRAVRAGRGGGRLVQARAARPSCGSAPSSRSTA